MKRGLLAAAVLLTSAGLASADYVIIVANVGGGGRVLRAGFGGGGMGGRRGGQMMGMRGGMFPGGGAPGMAPGGGAAGFPPGGGAAGFPPGGGAAGFPPGGGAAGFPPGGGAAGLPPGGGAAGGGFPPGAGIQGAPAPGMGAMGGRGGMMMGGGMAMGMPGGMMGGMMAGMMSGFGASTDALDFPVIAIVEVKAHKMPGDLSIRGIKTLAALNKIEAPEELLARLPPIRVTLPSRLGKSCHLLKKPSFGEMFVIAEGKDKAIPTVAQQFKEEQEKTMKGGAPSAADLLRLAEWVLQHGLVNEFPAIMKKLVEVDKSNLAAVAYGKVQADLDRNASNDASVNSWKGRLLPGYKVSEKPHYLIVHNAVEAEINTHGEHLENAFRGYYYWFALHRVALPVPRTRQVVILTRDKNDFDKLNKILSSGPVVVDGFFARRESLFVMTSQCQDEKYQALKTYWQTRKDKGYKRDELLETPKSSLRELKNAVALNDLAEAQLAGTVTLKIAEAQMLALMLRALEQEAVLATISHDASRQLLFASGLLPRNVAAPEWILFGMGSFFETPLQSPWPTIGAPSPYYLPRWRKMMNKGLEKTRVETLRKVVTDGYFRSVPPIGKSASVRKARTVSWSLTYFLAQQKLAGLRQYFAELSKMPRDLELDDTVLLHCFARAFGCVDGNNKVDDNRLRALADEWYGYWRNVNFDSESTMKDIRDKIAAKLEEAKKRAQQRQNNNNGRQPGMFPGGPGGFPGAPGGVQPPAAPPGGAFPQANPRPGGN